jgi:hypothetical protein
MDRRASGVLVAERSRTARLDPQTCPQCGESVLVGLMPNEKDWAVFDIAQTKHWHVTSDGGSYMKAKPTYGVLMHRHQDVPEGFANP